MKKEIAYLSTVYLLFIILMTLCGSVSGFFSEALFYVSFLIPVAVTLLLKRRLNLSFELPRVNLSKESLVGVLLFSAPTLALIFGISYVTSSLLAYFGNAPAVDVSGNIFLVIFKDALLTSVLEELLFRALPLALLIPYSKKGAILYSAAFFALLHCNLYQLPYAFIAGVIFAAADIIYESIVPSLIFHFMNNVISVFWLRYSSCAVFSATYVSVLFSIALVSLVIIFLKRRRLCELWSTALSEDGAIALSVEFCVMAFAALLIAFMNL